MANDKQDLEMKNIGNINNYDICNEEERKSNGE